MRLVVTTRFFLRHMSQSVTVNTIRLHNVADAECRRPVLHSVCYIKSKVEYINKLEKEPELRQVISCVRGRTLVPVSQLKFEYTVPL